MLDAHPNPCATCAAPLAADQRYCLECGGRHGPQRLDALAWARAGTPTGDVARPAEAVGATPRHPAGVRVPGPRVAAVLTMAMLACGIALGTASGERTATSAAAAGKRYVVVGGPPALGALPAAPAPAPLTRPVVAPEVAVPETPAAEPAAADPVPAEPAAADPVVADPVAETPTEPEPAETTPDEPPDPSADDGPAPAATPIPTAAPPLPPIKHVWVISLTDRKLTETFGPASTDPWFREVLVRQGALLNNYHATSGGTLANGVALLSGQGANPATEGDCAKPAEITPGTITGELQQVQGTGCVYPGTVGTLPEQLVGAGMTWKAYLDDVAPGKLSAAPSCEATRTPRNPFAYFDALTADGQCPQRVVGTDVLAADLAVPTATPNLSYVVPDACHDGSDVPCAPGAPAGLGAASPWLQGVLAQIQASQAYKDDGLVVIVADRSGPDGPGADTSARKGAAAPAGGGLVPALLLSKWITPGEQIATGYDHFALLRSLQDIFGVARLGQAAAPGLKGFGPRVFRAFPTPTP